MLDLSQYKALIFDMDGTLLDSSAVTQKVLGNWCQQHQLDFEKMYRECQGARIIDFLSQLAPHLDAEREAKALDVLEQQTTDGLKPIPGASQLLQYLDDAAMPWCIATSANRGIATLRLLTTGLPIANVLITSEDVSRGKPDPEHFVTAALRLQQKNQHCLAFEDSNNGVQAALSAGSDVVVIGSNCSIEHPRIVARLENYLELVQQLSAMRGCA